MTLAFVLNKISQKKTVNSTKGNKICDNMSGKEMQ